MKKSVKKKSNRPVGRPPETDANKLADDLLAYIKEKCESLRDVPILAEFACNHDLLRERIYEIAETKNGQRLSYAIKKCSQAKEYRLEKLGLAGKLNPGICAFSLKQLGWTENKENKINGDDIAKSLHAIADAMSQ